MLTDERFNKIEHKLDKITEGISRIDRTLAKQEEQIAYHILRTNLLEESLKPVQQHVFIVQGALKLVVLVSLLAGIVLAVIEILKALK